MQQIIWRATAFIATVAVVVMASGVAEPGSRGRQIQSGGGQPGSSPTAAKNQPRPENDNQGRSRIHANAS